MELQNELTKEISQNIDGRGFERAGEICTVFLRILQKNLENKYEEIAVKVPK